LLGNRSVLQHTLHAKAAADQPAANEPNTGMLNKPGQALFQGFGDILQ
jgi:hypothetical protein